MTAPAPHGLPRILLGLDDSDAPMSLAEHEQVHGPLPPGRNAITLAERAGLRGRGGADFPTAVKLRAVAERRRPVIVVNGSETEPVAGKDRLLLSRLPHLVLDGALFVAETIRAQEIVFVTPNGDEPAAWAMAEAINERRPAIKAWVQEGSGGYVSGEETAVIHSLGGGPAIPTFVPPRPFVRGYRNRPTLIQNAETLAQLALIARHGDAWYREVGTAEDPGSVLVTVAGAVALPGVYELGFGTPVSDLLDAAGGATSPLQALLIGGYFGTWMAADVALGVRLSRTDLKAAGASLGGGIVVALGQDACGLHESARIAGWLAGESAGQCGPCVHGLAAIGDGMAQLARGTAPADMVERLLHWCSEVRGRGACHHPNGVAGFVESALEVFAHEIPSHRQGRCGRRPSGLPLGPESRDAVPASGPAGRRRYE